MIRKKEDRVPLDRLFAEHKLTVSKRAQILQLLIEGMSLRAIVRTTDASINTISRLLVQAGEACAAYHDATVRDVSSKRVQVDEIWNFTYAKQKNVARAKAAPEYAGDAWTWTALDADSKLIVSWLVGGRDAGYATEFMQDLAGRLASTRPEACKGLRKKEKSQI